MKPVDMLSKQMQKGKPTKKVALGALTDMQGMLNGIMQVMEQMRRGYASLENAISQTDTHLRVLQELLLEKSVVSKEEWDGAWDKHVVQPQEEAIQKMAETMIASDNEEDQYFGKVIDAVRVFNFPAQEQNGEVIPGKAIRDFYLQMLFSPGNRQKVLNDLRQNFITDLPAFDFEAAREKAIKVQKEKMKEEALDELDRKMPDCHYCGKEDCMFCNPPADSEVECCGECEECEEECLPATPSDMEE